MPETTETGVAVAGGPATTHPERELPGVGLVRRTRRVLVTALGAALVYGLFTNAGASYCGGGTTGDGGFLDSDGRPTDIAPTCTSLTLSPNVLVFIAMAIVVFVGMGRVIKHASDEAAALRTLDRTAMVVVFVALASLIVSQVWFALLPLEEFVEHGGSLWYPFPFGAVTIETSPMQVGG